MPVPAPNFGQPPWSLETPTKPGMYMLRQGDMQCEVEVSPGDEGLLLTFPGGEPTPLAEFISQSTEWEAL